MLTTRSWGFILNALGSYQMIVYRETALLDSPFRTGQSLGWEEASSEASTQVEKSQYELNEKLRFPNTGREKGEALVDYLQVGTTGQFMGGINPVHTTHELMKALAWIMVGK